MCIRDSQRRVHGDNLRYETTSNERDNAIKGLRELKAKVKQNEELMLMTTEDSLQSQFKIKKLKEQIDEHKKVIEEKNKEISELEVQIKLMKEGLMQKEELSMEGMLFDFIRGDERAEANTKNKSSSRVETSNQLVAERVASTGEIKLDTVTLKNYSYSKPTYRALVNHLLPKEKNEKLVYSPPFPMWLHVVIRAIFDSKMNEVLFAYNKGKELARFPDFVYSWLGTFHIDKDTRTIAELTYSEKELSLIHICRCRRYAVCRSRWSPYH
eukprot:TRINITY_DN17364_c0_g1_i1.p1 TRINITY_DN17364_c0_g1~~TRINITY_DN17364_c0_g1_i1.p1  ORF type:complete len:269 (+),score=59.01 TRINITY_DN17364_c0_g1_i1:65-871(+)